jgi:predicted transcriptional regulator
VGTVHFQTLEYAAVLVGGEDELALRLGVSRRELDLWRSGQRPPLAMFLKAVDIVHDAAIAQLRSCQSKSGERNEDLRGNA